MRTPILTLDFSSVPIPHHWTPNAQRFAECFRLVPAPFWCSYGDIADAVGSNARGVARSLLAATYPRENADYPLLQNWAIDYIRLRRDDGTLRPPDEEEGTTNVRKRYERENELYVLMGGKVIDGAAVQELRFPVAELTRMWRHAA